ncbi:unnamed protein product [Anisakis simplex]|uniref:Kazal-like domain-containing protein n=1 Tax=Anisakis simplex TaxID=6269 RepID=A0A0M3JX63_ANISI|nr:unnamed protein product [Anisakis simplex]
MKILILLLLITQSSFGADESCRTACYKDKIPMCGAWLIDDNSNDCTGTYQVWNSCLAFSSETAISVVGIERFEVMHSSLRYGRPGHIEIKVCANPKPEIVWLTRGAVLQPGHSTHRMSALQLMQLKIRDSKRSQGPALPVPYCYKTYLVIGRVEKQDEHINVIVRNEVYISGLV